MYDWSRAVAAVFPSESAGFAALHRLQAAGCEASWLGISRTIDEHEPIKVIVRDTGGNWAEHVMRQLFGRFEDSLYDALIDHGVQADVAASRRRGTAQRNRCRGRERAEKHRQRRARARSRRRNGGSGLTTG